VSAVSLLLVLLGAVALACLVWGWIEAGLVRLRVLDVPVAGLPPELDGLRIAHLSDFHLGSRSRGRVATERAVEWVEGRDPDLVCVTGDLVSHPRGEQLLRELLARLGRPFVVLGNHDVAITRDPFSRAVEIEDLRELSVLLRDDATGLSVRGCPVQLVGVDPVEHHERVAAPWRHADPDAALRILLCHFPEIAPRLPDGAFDLVLAGHLHAGQLALPVPGGRIMLAHPRATYSAGLYAVAGGVMHVSPGTGTTFVPFRFFARPEATELVLRRAT
jgi:predicted MPP superfamily phosphohydrolase